MTSTPPAKNAATEGFLHIPAARRGKAVTDWLTSYHSFSFGDYFDPAFMGFGAIRVINDDRIAGGGGFPTHPHHDMEIVTLVFDGALAHRDSLGNGTTIAAGDVQRMSAGTGIRHSEFNASAHDPVHLLQIWILPQQKNLPPSYEQKHFSAGAISNVWRLVGSKEGREGSVSYHQDIDLYRAALSAQQKLVLPAAPTRMQWLHVVAGDVVMDDLHLAAGDAVALVGGAHDRILAAAAPSQLVLFDQPQLAG